MKVYVLEEWFKWEAKAILGIFSTKEKAQETLMSLSPDWKLIHENEDSVTYNRFYLYDEEVFGSIKTWEVD